MPWVAVDKEYWFEGPEGRVSLADMFAGRDQLIVYRAFYAPDITTMADGASYPDPPRVWAVRWLPIKSRIPAT